MARVESCGYEKLLATVMRDSLMGNPQTVFREAIESRASNVLGYEYFRTRSVNADWVREVPGSRVELHHALDLLAACKPLNLRRREHRWLASFVRHASRHGWCATFDGRSSPLCVEPRPRRRRARLGKGALRVYLALPEHEYRRLLLRAEMLHQSPNLWMNEAVADRLHAEEEREAIANPPAAPAPATPGSGVPF